MKKTTKIAPIFYITIATLLLQMSVFCTKINYLHGTISIINTVAIAMSAIMVIYLFLTKKRSAKNIALSASLAIIGTISYIITGDTLVVMLFIVSLIHSALPKTTAIKIDLAIKIIITIFIICNYALGLTDENTVMREGVARSTFGFAHPNMIGYIALMIFTDILYLFNKRKNKIVPVLSAIILLPILIATDSRTSLFFFIVMILVFLYENKKQNNNKYIGRKRSYLLPVFFLSLSFITTTLFINGNKYTFILDDTLSYRITYQAYYQKNEKVSFFGKELDLNSQPLDNAYYRCIYEYGIIGMLVIISALAISMKNSQKNDAFLNSIQIILLFYALSEFVAFKFAITPYWTIAEDNNRCKS